MKHFVQSQKDLIAELQGLVSNGLCEKACLLCDLEGYMRVVFDLKDSFPKEPCESAAPKLATAAGEFWTGQIWLDRDPGHSDGRLSPSEKALMTSIWKEAEPAIPGSSKVFLVNRRFSKETWFSESSELWPYIPLKTPPIISFYSFKGGVGRTTALASYAIQNARAGRRVVILDLDLEAPGLGSVFPISGGLPEVGVLDYLVEQPVVGSNFDPMETVYIFDDKNITKTGEINVVPAGRIDEFYLEKLAKLDYLRLNNSLPEDESPLRELIKKLRATKNPDLILIDSRAGLDDIGGLALSPFAHWHVLFGTDSTQSWDGLTLAIDHLGRQRIFSGKDQLDCTIVQAQVNPVNIENSRELFRQKSYEVFCNFFYDAPSNPNPNWPIPDQLAKEEPHYPVSIVHDSKLLGYNSISTIAEYLCEGDYRDFAQRLNSSLGLK